MDIFEQFFFLVLLFGLMYLGEKYAVGLYHLLAGVVALILLSSVVPEMLPTTVFTFLIIVNIFRAIRTRFTVG